MNSLIEACILLAVEGDIEELNRMISSMSHDEKETLLTACRVVEEECFKAINYETPTQYNHPDKAKPDFGKIDILLKQQQEIVDSENAILDKICNYWQSLTPGFTLNDKGRHSLKKLMSEFDIEEILRGMKIATEHYHEFENGKLAHDTVELALSKIAGICRVRRAEKETPNIQKILYIRGILKRRFDYVNEDAALRLLKKTDQLGATISSLEEHAKTARSWTQWKQGMESFILEQAKK